MKAPLTRGLRRPLAPFQCTRVKLIRTFRHVGPTGKSLKKSHETLTALTSRLSRADSLGKVEGIRHQLNAELVRLREAIPTSTIAPPEPFKLPVPVEEPIKQHRTALTIDSKGNLWKWKCGWWRVDINGDILGNRPPLSHAIFRRNVKILDPKDKAQKEVLHAMDKPGRHWRRMITKELYSHELFGNCYLLASDGCHAIIETVDGDHEKVCFENLSEHIGVRPPPRPSDKAATSTKEKKAKVVESLFAKYTQKLAQTK